MYLARFGLSLVALLSLAGAAAVIRPAAGAPKPKFEFAPIVYEVSTSGNNQKKLQQIFAAVNKANGGELSREEFIRRLKSREHFEIRFPIRCRACNGWKRVIPDSGNRGDDGKVDCKTCRGSGAEMRLHIVTWRAGVLTHLGDQRNPIVAQLIRELGDNASPHTWFNTARSFHSGERSQSENARAFAHAAYEQAVASANAAWRSDEPTSSDRNRLYRHIIDESLGGIAATAPRREEKETEAKKTPQPQPASAKP